MFRDLANLNMSCAHTMFFLICFLLGPPIIIVHPQSISVNISRDAQLQCQAYADPPNMTYVWRKNGENVYHTE